MFSCDNVEEAESSNDDESDYDVSDAESDELSIANDEEDYDPLGAESDDDARGCCHWSKLREIPPNQITPDDYLDDFGICSFNFDEDSKPHDVAEHIINDTFLDICIDATNAHGSNDPDYISRVGILPKNEQGRSFLKGFIAIKWHLSLIRYPNKRWAWSDDPLKAQLEVKKLMPFKIFQVITKHFSVVNHDNLPTKEQPNYHPLQNILAGVNVIKTNSAGLWKSGSNLCIDEGRVTSKSKRNAFKIRNPDKPIKMGWTIYKIGEKGQFGGYMITDHLVKVGKKTYTSLEKGKTYNIVEQLLGCHKGRGKLLVLDN